MQKFVGSCGFFFSLLKWTSEPDFPSCFGLLVFKHWQTHPDTEKLQLLKSPIRLHSSSIYFNYRSDIFLPSSIPWKAAEEFLPHARGGVTSSLKQIIVKEQNTEEVWGLNWSEPVLERGSASLITAAFCRLEWNEGIRGKKTIQKCSTRWGEIKKRDG